MRVAKLRALKTEPKRRMHETIPHQGRWLGQVVRGYFGYHAVPPNYPRLAAFRFHVTELYPSRASFIPGPASALPSNTPRWEPGARIAPAGICAGGALSYERPYRDIDSNGQSGGFEYLHRLVPSDYWNASRWHVVNAAIVGVSPSTS
jgi:hypothetical protein